MFRSFQIIFSGAHRFIVKVTEFKVFKFLKVVKVICGDAAE